MDLFVKEYGQSIKSVVLSGMVMCVVLLSLKLLCNELPVFNNEHSKDSESLMFDINRYSPQILSEDVIYAEYQAKFNLWDYVDICDYDNSDLENNGMVEGIVNVNKKGVYPVVVSVENNKGFSSQKRIYVIVE